MTIGTSLRNAQEIRLSENQNAGYQVSAVRKKKTGISVLMP